MYNLKWLMFIFMAVDQSFANRFTPLTVIHDDKISSETLDKIISACRELNKIETSKIKLAARLTQIKENDSVGQIASICEHLSTNGLAMFGASTLSSLELIKSITNKYNIPYFTWSDFGLRKDAKAQSLLYMRPYILPAITQLIKYYNISTNIYYIYNHDQGNYNLNELLEYQMKHETSFKDIIIRKITNMFKCRDMLRSIKSFEDTSQKITFIIDLNGKESYKAFFNQIMELSMIQTKFEYIITYLSIHELNLNNFQHGGARITGLSLIDYNDIKTIQKLSDVYKDEDSLNQLPYLSYETALILDSLGFYAKAINSFDAEIFRIFNEQISFEEHRLCNLGNPLFSNQMSKERVNVIDLIKNNSYEGLTGHIAFDNYGHRRNFNFGIYKVDYQVALKKIGNYSSKIGLRINAEEMKRNEISFSKNKTKLIVISLIDEPFFMYRRQTASTGILKGNDRFMGYCVDLTKKLSEMIGFTYELRLVKDHKFGAKNGNGTWNGMVGELVRNEAQLAVSSLTISWQREQAIGFSMPFMNMGISIMIKKPKKEKPGVFSFLAPLDSNIWLCVILAYITVSVVMFMVCRFSPNEWRYISQIDKFKNHFSILNTLWFNLAAFMQQGVDFAPRSLSGRLVASVWWFFNLILISSYTANLAAFLTVERMVNPIESAEDLIKQNEIRYGAVEDGSTKAFFKNSKVATFESMWNNMNSNEWNKNVFVKTNQEGAKMVRESKGKYAFLLESSVNEYLNEKSPCDTIKVGQNLDSKGYGIASQIDSQLKEPINLAILQLKEEGFLDELKTRWWYDRSECGNTGKMAQSKDSSKGSLNLINVAGIFYILIAGLILSLIIAFLEILFQSKRQAENNQIFFKDALKSSVRQSISGYEESH